MRGYQADQYRSRRYQKYAQLAHRSDHSRVVVLNGLSLARSATYFMVQGLRTPSRGNWSIAATFMLVKNGQGTPLDTDSNYFTNELQENPASLFPTGFAALLESAVQTAKVQRLFRLHHSPQVISTTVRAHTEKVKPRKGIDRDTDRAADKDGHTQTRARAHRHTHTHTAPSEPRHGALRHGHPRRGGQHPGAR